jgi:predicted dehydrogenase
VNESKLPIAVIGCGAVAAGHYLPAIAASSRLTASVLVDRDAARSRALASRWRVPATATEIGDVARHARAAVVALPNSLHAPVTIDLLRAGVHVLVEKPMATRAADCDAMAEAARKSGATLAVGLQFRYFDSTRWVSDALRNGLLGPLRRFDLRLGVVSRWPFASDYVLRRETAGGGVLTDYGAHVLDLLCLWLGDFGPPRYRDDAAAASSPTASSSWFHSPACRARSRSAGRATCPTPADSRARRRRSKSGSGIPTADRDLPPRRGAPPGRSDS